MGDKHYVPREGEAIPRFICAFPECNGGFLTTEEDWNRHGNLCPNSREHYLDRIERRTFQPEVIIMSRREHAKKSPAPDPPGFSVTIHVSATKSLRRDLVALAKEEECSLSALCSRILDEYLVNN